ncbi:MAG: flagellar protein FlaG [Polyangiales bacterium]
MAIRSIDGPAGAELLIHPKALATSKPRSWRPPGAESANTPAGVAQAQEAERAQAEQQQRPNEVEEAPAYNASSLRFHIDQDSGRTIAELVDPEGTVLRQMPTEEALEVAKAIGKYQGMFVDLKV